MLKLKEVKSPWMFYDVRIPDVGDLFDGLAGVIEEVLRSEPGKASDFCFAKRCVSRLFSNGQGNLLPRLPNHDRLCDNVNTR